MGQNKVLQLVYTLFLGILVAIFVGVGINTFYPPPVGPAYPSELTAIMGKEPTVEQQALQVSWENKSRQFEEQQMQPYSRNVSIIALASGVVLLAISILYEKKIKVMSDGVMLGGLLTLLYGIGRGFASQESTYTFVLVTISLAIVLFLGYHRFVKTPLTQ